MSISQTYRNQSFNICPQIPCSGWMLSVLLICVSLLNAEAQDSWCEVSSPSNSNVLMSFNDSANGWVVAYYSNYPNHYARIYRTLDSGNTWHLDQEDLIATYSNTARINCMHMIDTLNGWIGGSVYLTNGNVFWPLLLRRAWIPGTVGIKWHRQDTKLPENSAIGGVWVFSANKVMVASSRGHIAQTTDAGETWETIDTVASELPIQKLYFQDERLGWLYSWDQLFRTTDGGHSWSRVDYGKPFQLLSIHFADEKNGWIGGEAGNIRKTTDGGSSWSRQWSTTGVRIEDIEFADSRTGFAVGGGVYGNTWLDSSRVLKTVDGGVTWEQTKHPRDSWIVAIQLLGATNAKILTGKYVYSYCGDQIVTVEESNHEERICEKLYFNLIGEQVTSSTLGFLLEYDPCSRNAKMMLRQP